MYEVHYTLCTYLAAATRNNLLELAMAAFIFKRKAHVKTSIFKCIRTHHWTGLLAGSKILGAISERDIANKNIQPGDWNALRDMFPLSRDYIQLSTFLLASHPKPVSDAIENIVVHSTKIYMTIGISIFKPLTLKFANLRPNIWVVRLKI